jgi:glycosyl transferase family 25
MKIFVINLEKDRARRESVQRQLDNLKLPFELVSGVLGAALSPAELAECYDDRKARRNLCMSLVPSQIGCALSHTRVYQKIVERNLDCALILEDDVILPAMMPKMMLEIQNTINVDRPEVILLSPAIGSHGRHDRRLPGGEFEMIPFKAGYYTSSYIVTHFAARALLKELYPVGDVADCWARLKSYKVVDLFVINPPLIEQNQTAFGSSTNEDNWKLKKKNALDKLILKCRRAGSKFIDFFYAIYRRKVVPYAGIDLNPKSGMENKKGR